MPAHPDKMLIRCSSAQCGKWMHDDCLRRDALMRVYERLGKKTPQVFDNEPELKKEEAEGLVSPPATDTEKKEADEQPALEEIKLPLFVGPRPAAERASAKKGPKKEAYRGLFDATVRLNDGPTVWQIKDLRPNVSGGSKTWLEQAFCLFCNRAID